MKRYIRLVLWGTAIIFLVFRSYLQERFDGDAKEVSLTVETAERIIPNTLNDYFGTKYESIYDITEIDDVEEFRRKIKTHPILKNLDMSVEPRYTEILKWYRLFLKALNANSVPMPVYGELSTPQMDCSSQHQEAYIIPLFPAYIRARNGLKKEFIWFTEDVQHSRAPTYHIHTFETDGETADRTTHKTDGETTYASNIKDYSINKEISNHHTRMSIDDLEKILVEDVEWQKSIICQLNNHRISEPAHLIPYIHKFFAYFRISKVTEKQAYEGSF